MPQNWEDNHSGMSKHTFLALFLLCVCGLQLTAQQNRNTLQNRSGANRNNQNIDNRDRENDTPALELKDREVRQYWLKVQALGYSIDEVPALAKAQGFSDREAQRLYDRIVRLERLTSKSNRKDQTGLLFSKELERQEDSIALIDLKQKIFGMDVFERAFLTSFARGQSVATPANYVIGPGDVLDILVYGTSQQYYKTKVSSAGTVVIQGIGPVTVSGLTIDAARNALFERLKTIYAGLTGRNPSIFLEITLSGIRSIRVNIIGEVERPGTYLIPAYSGIFNALYEAGGPTVTGTFREIKVFRGGQVIQDVDLYGFLIEGKNPMETNLQDEDIIMVGTFNKRIEIEGEVKRPGVFELKGDETLGKILRFAGELTPQANQSNLLVERYNGEDQFAEDIPLNRNATYDFENGDVLGIRAIRNFDISRVEIQGAIRIPGIYSWNDTLKLSSLIEKAGGAIPGAFSQSITVFRFNEDLTSIAINVNLNESPDFKLKKGDVINITSKKAITETRFLQISGEVNSTGVFPFYEGITLGDLIILAGGLQNSGYKGKIEIARRTYDGDSPSFELISLDGPSSLFENNIDDLKYELNPLDHVFVRAASGYQEDALVTVVGEVNHPGEYVITSSDLRIHDILERAGGFTDYAFFEGVALLRQRNTSNGEKQALKDQIDQLEKLRVKIIEEDQVFQNTSNEEDLGILDNRIVELRKEYEKKYLTTEEGIVELLTIDPNQGLAFSDAEIRTRGSKRDRIGVDVESILADPENSEDNLVLLPGDVLEIPRHKEIVSIRGEVLYPTSVKFDEKKKFKDYISQAGGGDLKAKIGRSYIIYANGDAKRVKNFLFFRKWPETRPGSQIFVPGGKIRQVFNPERIIALTSSLLTTYLVLERINN